MTYGGTDRVNYLEGKEREDYPTPTLQTLR